ncbi:MAG: TetR/AcrR family transcriptional regulator [Solirubrobacterales bacterium]|nr:TetR/AcrR family transcriptional regulator [Solirubrobacterales bacterium]
MSPRASADQARRTRAAILDEVVSRASLEGLESITIGTLAETMGMSKAGVIGPFGSKEELQLAALEGANEIFRREVWEPAAERSPGRDRLEAIAEAWISYLERDVFPGGCFLTTAAVEFDNRPGRVRDAVHATWRVWDGVLERDAQAALEAGELPAGTDPAQVAFEMNAVAMAVNEARQLRGDDRAGERGRTAMARVLSPAAR